MSKKSSYPRIVIAGLRGGSGKTTLSLGLIAAWREKGLTITPYKKGPDYIDAGWLSSAAMRPCFNLDPFLIGREKVLSSFKGHFGDADCAVIEGNRGLYDGMDAAGTYSTAELSKILKAPVIIILDCTKVTRTAGAMVLGMQKFDRKVEIKGVVLNQIAGARHEKVITTAIEKYCGIPVLGAIPKLKHSLSERHMGLTPFQEHPEVEKAVSFTADIAKKYLDLDGIWNIAKKAKPIHDTRCRIQDEGNRASRFRVATTCIMHHVSSDVKIGVIRDSAFQFYYPENFEELERRGAELIEISALTEKKLPEIDALYIGGGFPETNAIALARNKAFRNSVKQSVENGLPLYAECGGLMYLGESLVLEDRTYPMTGIFPVKFSLEKRPQAHGYSIVEVSGDNPFYSRSTEIRGHEFHYSRVLNPEAVSGFGRQFHFVFKMKRGEGIINKMDGLCYKNVLATYTHVHALGTPEWAEGVLKKAYEYRRKRG